MQDTITLDPSLRRRAGRASQGVSRPGRDQLWEVLAGRWLRRLDRRIEAELRWLDHRRVPAQCRCAADD